MLTGILFGVERLPDPIGPPIRTGGVRSPRQIRHAFAVKGWAVLFVAASACAHTPNLDLRPEPAPPGEEVAAFSAHDGTKLWRCHWLPTAPKKGILIIQHGLRDHSDNYDHLAPRQHLGIAEGALLHGLPCEPDRELPDSLVSADLPRTELSVE